jgi:hypothetical protein
MRTPFLAAASLASLASAHADQTWTGFTNSDFNTGSNYLGGSWSEWSNYVFDSNSVTGTITIASDSKNLTISNRMLVAGGLTWNVGAGRTLTTTGIPPQTYDQFMEDFGHAFEGGIHAEKVRGTGFEGDDFNCFWKAFTDDGSAEQPARFEPRESSATNAGGLVHELAPNSVVVIEFRNP